MDWLIQKIVLAVEKTSFPCRWSRNHSASLAKKFSDLPREILCATFSELKAAFHSIPPGEATGKDSWLLYGSLASVANYIITGEHFHIQWEVDLPEKSVMQAHILPAPITLYPIFMMTSLFNHFPNVNFASYCRKSKITFHAGLCW